MYHNWKSALRFTFHLAICFGACISCSSGHQNTPQKVQCKKLYSLAVKYARGFSIDYYDGFKVINVNTTGDSTKPVLQYILCPSAKPLPFGFENAVLIDLPVHKIACISTTQIAELAELNLIDSIDAVTNTTLIYNEAVNQKLKQGLIADVGTDELNYEKILSINPSFVLSSGGFDGGDKMQLKLNSLHIKYVTDLEYREQNPLARAEWIKFIAAFYGRETEADSVFNGIEKRYQQLKAKAAEAKRKPTVLCNLPFKEIWYMPCGDNYMAMLIADAGGDFFWKDAKANNGFNLNLDYETVYNTAANADIWINTNFANNLDDLKRADKKNAFFKAWKTGQVYNNNKRNTANGGFDFWESGTMNPDKILADLIDIFHPELMESYELYYYQKLK